MAGRCDCVIGLTFEVKDCSHINGESPHAHCFFQMELDNWLGDFVYQDKMTSKYSFGHAFSSAFLKTPNNASSVSYPSAITPAMISKNGFQDTVRKEKSNEIKEIWRGAY